MLEPGICAIFHEALEVMKAPVVTLEYQASKSLVGWRIRLPHSTQQLALQVPQSQCLKFRLWAAMGIIGNKTTVN